MIFHWPKLTFAVHSSSLTLREGPPIGPIRVPGKDLQGASSREVNGAGAACESPARGPGGSGQKPPDWRAFRRAEISLGQSFFTRKTRKNPRNPSDMKGI